MAGRLGSMAVRSISAADVLNQGQWFNWVWRDKTQVDNGNAEDAFHPLIQEGVAHIPATNRLGLPIFNSFEYGGQQPGASAMKGILPGDEMDILRSILGPDIPLRILFRAMNGNSLGAHTESSLQKWVKYLDEHGDPIILKQFHYLCNPDELAPAIKVGQQLGVAQEVAIPHSPDPGYIDFFNASLERLAPIAQSVGSISVKRMVAGLTEREVMDFADVFFRKAAELNIPKVTLHAHDDVNEACALFLQLAAEYGEELNFMFEPSVDVAHKGSGHGNHPDLFPNTLDIIDILDKRGFKLPVNDKQIQAIESLDETFRKVDKQYADFVIPTTVFTREKRIQMGMPDGGFYYSYLAVLQARFHESHAITKDQALQLFIPFYCFFRRAFGMPTSVTPGHKRIEMATIVLMNNMLGALLVEAETIGKHIDSWTEEDIFTFLSSHEYHVLFDKMDAATVDAFRDHFLPQPLTEKAKDFLSKAHMRNFLKQTLFDNLTAEQKTVLIEASSSKSDLIQAALPMIKVGLIPKLSLSPEIKHLSISLYQAAGRREYIESVSAKDAYANNISLAQKWRSEGYELNMSNEALATAALCAPTPEAMLAMGRSDRQPMPSSTVSAVDLQKATALWQNDVMAKPGKLVDSKLRYALAIGLPCGDYQVFNKPVDWFKIAELSR